MNKPSKPQLTRTLFALFVVFSLSSCNISSRSEIIAGFKSKRFTALHQLVLQQSFENIAVLPDDNFIVIDKTVINRDGRTFGEEPQGSDYQTYYTQGSSEHFESLADLLKQRGTQISEQMLADLTWRMQELGIGDILKDKKNSIVVYSWDMSAVWGADGILYSHSGEIPAEVRSRYGSIEPLGNGFYFWATG